MADKPTGNLTKYILKNSKNNEKNLKYDFMPALLEIIERPSHIAGRVIVIAIATLLVFAIIWASIAKIDVVINGSGYVTTALEESSVSAQTGGIIKTVNAASGDYVAKGDVLIQLDTSETEISIKQLEETLALLEVQKKVAEMYVEDVNAIINVDEYPIEHQYAVKKLVYENETVKLQLNNYPSSADSIKLQYESGLVELLYELTHNITVYEEELELQRLAYEKLSIKAPVSGYILTSEAVYVGQMIQSLQPLFVIIPSDSEYIFEGYIDNKDISSVKVGDMVQIKLQAYSYSDYGAVEGEIVYISPSVITNDANQSVYEIQVKIDEENCHKDIEFISGMAGSIEVNVGKRSVMDYFLEPILGSLDKSLKEK